MKNKKTTKLNKSAWIRKQAKRLDVHEVVAKAKSEGIKLTPEYVSSIRSAARRQAKLEAAGKPAAPKPAKKAAKSKPSKGKAKKAAVVAVSEPKAAKPNRALNGHANSIHA